MKNIIKVFSVTIVIIVIRTSCKAQTISFGIGPVHTYTNQTKPLIKGINYLYYSYVQKWFGFHSNIYRTIDLNIALANYDILTRMPVDKYIGKGFTGARITRLDVGLSYNILKSTNRAYIKPSFVIGHQYARKIADLWSEQFRVFGPDYYQTKLPVSEGKSNFQLVPVVGINIGIKFLKRIEAGILIQGIYGYRTFQSFEFYYYHKDSPAIERTARFESRGTGINSALYLGVNIANKSKLQNKH